MSDFPSSTSLVSKLYCDLPMTSECGDMFTVIFLVNEQMIFFIDRCLNRDQTHVLIWDKLELSKPVIV